MNVPTPDSTAMVDELYGPLYRFALSLVGAPAAASDLTQEAFFRWFKQGGELRDPAKVKSWLFTTLYREFLRTNRRANRFPHHELDEVESELPAVAPEELDQLDGALVMGALQQVEETYRAPLSLFYLEAFSYAQIAEALDVPAGTVMSRLSRGRDQLRRHLRNRLTAEEQKLIPFAAAKTR
jgi:RNA polymerase sigma-70 factor (ECF subfamily)